LFRIAIISDEKQKTADIEKELAGQGFSCFAVTSEKEIAAAGSPKPDLVLINTDGPGSYARFRELSQTIKQEKKLPVIVALGREGMETFGLDSVDDFVIRPIDPSELALRASRLIRQREIPASQKITSGSLIIDLSRCEVWVGTDQVMLAFKEYQLLKFLAASPGRVFSRETLLDRVWGSDYYGGDRTVDVHIRKLRSKLEERGEQFIETVRNIGYRFLDK
jgi:DNA-binding response OmpR family regulator